MSGPAPLRSIGDLVGDAFGQMAHLVQNEMRLARAEIADKAAQAGRGVAFIAVGLMLVTPGLVLCLIALAMYLTTLGLTAPVAHFVAGIGCVAIGAVLAMVGASRLKPEALAPNVTIDQVRRDVAAARDAVS